MELKEVLVQSCRNTLPMFGLEPEFTEETSYEMLASGKPVNILIGLTSGVNGNIVVSLNKNSALEIISGMMGGVECTGIDEIGESALGEMANMLIGSAVAGLDGDDVIELSPPTLITGDKLFLMVNNMPSKNLVFNLCDEEFQISYSIG